MPSNPVTNEHGNKYWFDDQNKYHRTDGPAIEWFDGDKFWYIHGIRYRIEAEYWNKIKELGLDQIERQPRVSRFKKLEIR